jgi:hypothetical protein
MNPYTYHNRKTPAPSFGVKTVVKAVLTEKIHPLPAFGLILFVALCVAVMAMFAQYDMEPGGSDPIAVRHLPPASEVLGASTYKK